ncbi:MAG TPA: triose-phosphate isomerase [Ruminococcaceae bacterium]|nr:triose-phosphate isomerase [Oscillospiraceae bacterium]
MNKNLRKAIIAGNWKMNNNKKQSAELINSLKPLVAGAGCDVVVCVPFTSIETVAALAGGSNIKVGAQNCHWAEKGAFTGEISADMLKESGVEYVVLGHSERRQYFGETDATVNARVKAAVAGGLKVILCVGELLEEREQGITDKVITTQVTAALKDISAEQLKNIIFAYEPVWAIGTGKTATEQQADEVCGLIREITAKLYDKKTADETAVLYGGSMNAQNAAALLAQPNIDGGLIGGASLKAEDFSVIVKAASL